MKDNRQKWVKALRSGDYKQGVGALRQGDKFCCLGVACDLYGKETKKKQAKWVRRDHNYVFLEKYGSLPEDVRDWLGLRDVCGFFNEGYLTQMNDKGLTFNEIANLIESEPIGLLLPENNVETN